MRFILLIVLVVASDARAYCERRYEGVIGGKYEIEVLVSDYADQASGEYRYKKYNVPIALEGSILPNGDFVFVGDDGKFVGRVLSDILVRGEWESSDKRRRLPFELKQTPVRTVGKLSNGKRFAIERVYGADEFHVNVDVDGAKYDSVVVESVSRCSDTSVGGFDVQVLNADSGLYALTWGSSVNASGVPLSDCTRILAVGKASPELEWCTGGSSYGYQSWDVVRDVAVSYGAGEIVVKISGDYQNGGEFVGEGKYKHTIRETVESKRYSVKSDRVEYISTEYRTRELQEINDSEEGDEVFRKIDNVQWKVETKR